MKSMVTGVHLNHSGGWDTIQAQLKEIMDRVPAL